MSDLGDPPCVMGGLWVMAPFRPLVGAETDYRCIFSDMEMENFVWKDYLSQCNAEMAPVELFDEVPDSSVMDHFKASFINFHSTLFGHTVIENLIAFRKPITGSENTKLPTFCHFPLKIRLRFRQIKN
jgi:hypothetical protein